MRLVPTSRPTAVCVFCVWFILMLLNSFLIVNCGQLPISLLQRHSVRGDRNPFPGCSFANPLLRQREGTTNLGASRIQINLVVVKPEQVNQRAGPLIAV